MPRAIGEHCLHELVGDANGIVRVLPGDRQVCFAFVVGIEDVQFDIGDSLPHQRERALDVRPRHATV